MDVELRYWRSNEPPPEGWVRHDGLDDTHHGRVREDGGFSIIVKAQTTLCACGKQLVTEDRGHHVVCQCGQVLEGCCGDV